MKLTQEQSEQFKELTGKLIQFIKDNYHPHVTVIITDTHAELMEGIVCHEA